MSSAIQKREARCKRRIRRRLRRRNWAAQLEPMFRGRNLHYQGSLTLDPDGTVWYTAQGAGNTQQAAGEMAEVAADLQELSSCP